MNVTGNPRVATEPKLLKSEGKTPVLSLRVVEDRNVKVKGQWTKKPVYITLLAFGKRAESLAARLKKGDLLKVNCELSEREYKDKTGATRNVHEILAGEVTVLKHAAAKS